jgi:hypothetical protein
MVWVRGSKCVQQLSQQHPILEQRTELVEHRAAAARPKDQENTW